MPENNKTETQKKARTRAKTVEQRVRELPPGEDRARLSQLLYHLEMIAICKAEGRKDVTEWTRSFAAIAEGYNKAATLKNYADEYADEKVGT